MKKRWFSSGETSLQILDVLIFSAVATLASGGLSLVIPHVGFLLAVGFGIPLSIFSWGVFHLARPAGFNRQWDRAERFFVPLLWLIAFLAVTTWISLSIDEAENYNLSIAEKIQSL